MYDGEHANTEAPKVIQISNSGAPEMSDEKNDNQMDDEQNDWKIIDDHPNEQSVGKFIVW